MWVEPEAGVAGVPFFVMAHVAGTVPFGKPSIHAVGWLPTLTPGERRRLWDSALDCLVAVHEVDWRRTHSFLAGPGGCEIGLRPHLERLRRWYRWATADREYPTTDAALDFVFSRGGDVHEGDPVLVWGDARIGNMIFGSDLSVAAAIDWEVASIGPPAIDVAHWLFFDEFLTSASGVERLAGLPDRATTLAEYQTRSGRSIEDLEYYEVLQLLFMATTLIRQADIRLAQGRLQPGTRMGHDNTVTQMLARRLGLPVPELASDYLAHRHVAGSASAPPNP
jgi:aminoglycoside phosphotransferase (APT) family kinase protein